jgi:peptide/nickel transport system permease protein
MRQRVVIAIAIANDPAVLIADEPTAALDVTVQAQILDLIAGLQRERGLALVFITHNLPIVAAIAHRVAVVYAGQVVEDGPAGAVLAAPLHPYTRALLASAPAEDGSLPQPIAGTVPQPHALPPGCAFAPRCGHRTPVCVVAQPPVLAPQPDRHTRCLRWSEL